MKLLDGSELAGYIKERQAKQVRALRQSWRTLPKLAIVQTIDDPVIDAYVRLKKRYGDDILVEVETHTPVEADLLTTIRRLNDDPTVHGIIIQLPLADMSLVDAAVNAVAPEKDVDGLGAAAVFEPATAVAIDWLLAGYNIAIETKQIAIVGNGRLVGQPLSQLWRSRGLDVTVFDEAARPLDASLRDFSLIVTATGVPSLITSDMVQVGAVVVDAGTAAEHGKIVGDLADDVRERDDLTITPTKGGVGPLTVVALFDNVIRAARVVADAKGQQDIEAATS